MVREDVLKVINKFYPKGLSAYSDGYDLTTEYITHKEYSKEITPKMWRNWELLKERLPRYPHVLDYTALPGFNKCFELNFSFHISENEKYFVVYYLSVLYSGYCYVICDFFTDTKHTFSQCPISANNYISSINELVEKHFSGYRLMPWPELREVVPDYSLQTPNPWKSGVFYYLFTRDPRFDKYL